jgi:transposase InsO family protein
MYTDCDSWNASFDPYGSGRQWVRVTAWKTRTDAEIAVAGWVSWYNHHRIHRALGDIPPAQYETNHYASIKAPAHGRS